ALFVIVISAVATDKAPWSGILAPIAIGGFIFTAATVVGPISGGSFNPARSIAPAIYTQDATDLWIYIIGPLIGGAIGGVIYWLIRSLRGPGEVEEMAGN
ncbi:MAG: aquaporin, partial [Actinobacteria bacterium]|nr:aquaporin [Actinomycetota bacterium]